MRKIFAAPAASTTIEAARIKMEMAICQIGGGATSNRISSTTGLVKGKNEKITAMGEDGAIIRLEISSMGKIKKMMRGQASCCN